MKNTIIGILAISTLFFAWLAVSASSQNTMQKLYKEWNTFTMYEDGSYVAEGHDNVHYRGCIKGALCND